LKLKGGNWLKWKPIVSFLVVVAIFYFLGRQFLNNYEGLAQYHWEIRYPFFIISFVFLFGNYILEAWIWKKLLEVFDVHLSVSKCFKIINLSQLGKYIPGKFWIYLGQFYLGGKEGISKTVILLSNFFLLILMTIGGMIVFSSSYLIWTNVHMGLALGLWILVIVALLLLHPWIFKRIVSILKGWIGTSVVDYSYLKILYLFLWILLDWAIYLSGFYIFLQSFYPVTLRELVIYGGIFAISGLLGLYSLFTPGGLGVREGVQVYLMSMFLPISMAVLISIFSRIWMTLAEAGAAVVSLKIKQ
jgi:uncharacterized membrane protein YbhN (UPF0104 family)